MALSVGDRVITNFGSHQHQGVRYTFNLLEEYRELPGVVVFVDPSAEHKGLPSICVALDDAPVPLLLKQDKGHWMWPDEVRPEEENKDV